MNGTIATTAAKNPRIVFTTVMLVLLLGLGLAGEAAAHNPAGHAVPACEKGAEVVEQANPNCHS